MRRNGMNRRIAVASAAFIIMHILAEKKRNQKKKRWWIKKIYTTRNNIEFLRDLNCEPESEFKNFTRMSTGDFVFLLNAIKDKIIKENTNLRKSIAPAERLALTLRFLATGDSYTSLQYLFKISKQAISTIIPEVCQTIIESLMVCVKVNFLLTQFTALLLAGLLRKSLSPASVTATTRHVFCLVIGLALGTFSFGRQAIHLAALPALCYVAMRTQNPLRIQRIVLATALIYLSCVHFHRQMYNYGSYTLDISGPLMVITQKVTSLAFSIHDGLTRRQEDLTAMQRHQAIQKMPSALEYFSYVFHFQSLMAGPVIFYRDYIDFINGQNLPGRKSLAGYNKHSAQSEIVLEPSPALVVVKKVAVSLICATMFVTFIPIFPIQEVKEEDFLENTSAFYKIFYLMVTTMLARFKYYHAWIFADAICNNSGLGFDGYDEKGRAKWDLNSNVDILKFETSLNLKESIEHWNKGTNRWLRSLVYERAGRQKVLYTYALSALWHGFYPGYYLTFANGAFFTVAYRVARRSIRPYFLGSNRRKFLYDVLTFVTTRVVMAYITFSFVLLEFMPSVKVYLYFYLFPHILALAAIVLLPRLLKVSAQTTLPEKRFQPSQEISNGSANKLD